MSWHLCTPGSHQSSQLKGMKSVCESVQWVSDKGRQWWDSGPIKKSKDWNSSLRQIRRRLLTKENSGVTKETPAASREGRTDRVCRCGLKIRWERPPWCDRRNRRRSSQIYGKSRTRCFQAADDINCQISQDIGNRRRGMQRSANNISNRMKIAQMIVNFGNFMSSILICPCYVFWFVTAVSFWFVTGWRLAKFPGWAAHEMRRMSFPHPLTAGKSFFPPLFLF